MKYITILLIILVALSGCDFVKEKIGSFGFGGEKEILKGSISGGGLKITIASTPKEIFVGQGLQIPVLLENTGKSEIENGILAISGGSVSVQYSSPTVFHGIFLEGKSEFVEGEKTTRLFEIGGIVLPSAKQRTERLIVTACYQYTTEAAPVICVNPKLAAGQQPIETGCNFVDAQIEKDQGAPVVVTKVETWYDLPNSEIEFRIHVSNTGGGQVVGDENYQFEKTNSSLVIWPSYYRMR